MRRRARPSFAFGAFMLLRGAGGDEREGEAGGKAVTGFWPDIHMTPDEGVRAHLDLQGGKPSGLMLPIHWGTFNLAFHPWAEPADRTMIAAHEAGFASAAPRPGDPFEPAARPAVEPWWRAVADQPAAGWPEWPAVAPVAEPPVAPAEEALVSDG